LLQGSRHAGKTADLRRVGVLAAAAQYYPAIYWPSMIRILIREIPYRADGGGIPGN
jgi:hypothetical protein